MRVLVFQHLDVEHPGILRDFMRADGIEWDTIALDEGDAIPSDLGRWDALLVMGGPMDVWQEDLFPWLIQEKSAIRQWVAALKKPYLGICLGHQLLADALGGKVGPMERPEVGICPVRLTGEGERDPMIATLGPAFECLQWHGAEVKRLPEAAETLAVNADGCIEALRVGECAWGIQFHVEITKDTVAEWSVVPEYAEALRRTLGEDGPGRFDAQAATAMPAFNLAARRLYDAFKMAASTPANPA